MSIPDSFNASWASKEVETEILGQSIEYKLHHSVMNQVHKHIESNFGKRTIVKYSSNQK